MTMITYSSLSLCYHFHHHHNQNVISAGGRWASFRGLVMLTFSFWYLTIQWPFRCRESTSGVSTTVRWEDNCRWPPPFLGDHSDGCGKYGEDITLMMMMMMMMMTLSMLRSINITSVHCFPHISNEVGMPTGNYDRSSTQSMWTEVVSPKWEEKPLSGFVGIDPRCQRHNWAPWYLTSWNGVLPLYSIYSQATRDNKRHTSWAWFAKKSLNLGRELLLIGKHFRIYCCFIVVKRIYIKRV